MNQPPSPIITQETGIKKFLKPKFIFITLGIIILIEALLGIASVIKTNTVPVASNIEPVSDSTPVIADGSFTISSITDKYKVGDKILVSVNISSGGNGILGADLVLHFDPAVFSVSKDSIVTGKIFSNYPLVDINQKTGVIRISGISEEKSGFNSEGNFANVAFTAKLKGSTTISITYKDGETTDSNLVSMQGVDVLKKVNNLKLEIN